MANPIATDRLSPLDQIRLAEAEVTRKVIAAREQAEQNINEALQQAALLKKQAQQAGSRKGQLRYKEIVRQAEEEGRLLVEHARLQAAEMRRRGVCADGFCRAASLELSSWLERRGK